MATITYGSGEEQSPYFVIAKDAAHAFHEAGVPSRRTRFVPPAEGLRGVLLLLDGWPSPRREFTWRRVIREIEARGGEVAARTSAPQSGPQDGAVEVLAIFASDPNDDGDIEAVWADACTAEGGQA